MKRINEEINTANDVSNSLLLIEKEMLNKQLTAKINFLKFPKIDDRITIIALNACFRIKYFEQNTKNS